MKNTLCLVLMNVALVLTCTMGSSHNAYAQISEQSNDDGFPGEPTDGPTNPAPTPNPAPPVVVPTPKPPAVPTPPTSGRSQSSQTDRMIGGTILFGLGGIALYSWTSLNAASWIMPAVITGTAVGSGAALTGTYLRNRVSPQWLARHPMIARIASTNDFRLYSIGAAVGFGACYLALKHLSGHSI